jgi:MFS family permease
LFQTAFGWSAIKSGSVVLFVFVGNIGIKPATSFLLNRFGFRPVLVAACVTLAASLVAAGFVTEHTPIGLIIMIAIVSGAARSVGGTSYNTLSFCDIAEPEMPHANSLSATAGQLAAGLGVAVATIVVRLGEPIGRLITGHETTRIPYTIAFCVIAFLPVAALLGVTRLNREAGNAARTAQLVTAER